MPVNEIFGRVLGLPGTQGEDFRQAVCPHMGVICDGGGNRNMARLDADDEQIAPLFDVSVREDGHIPCGICSIRSAGRGNDEPVDWAICPRRLLAFEGGGFSYAQRMLGSRILQLAGFRHGDSVRVWSEITLSERNPEFNVRYRLDYVLRRGNEPPVIIEVMTASTSGGNRRRGNDIQSAFRNAVLYANGALMSYGDSPGINIRQVWARMASQIIVKSQIANGWGGHTIWVVQDALVNYMRANTGLRLENLHSEDWQPDEVNMISANINDPQDVQLYKGPIYPRRQGEICWMDLLGAPGLPAIEILTDSLTDDNAIADIIV